MIDCFISTLALERHRARQEVAKRCISEYINQKGLRVWILNFGAANDYRQWLDGCGAHRVLHDSPIDDLSWIVRGSERRRFLFAHRLSESSIYVVADDDCLPVTLNWVEEGQRILQARPQFGMLSLDGESVLRRLRPELFADNEVTETLSCGGVRFIRKGAVKHYKGYEGDYGYDRLHARSMQAEELKVGFFKHLFRKHLGAKCSVYRERREPGIENDRPDGSIAFD